MRAIFISYRRDDAEGHAGRLFEDLSDHFGKASVFMDVTGIEPGRDFRHVIEQQVASCGVLLAVIGKSWLTATDAGGRRRLDDPYDFVRLETMAALKRDIPVVPVLVHGAHMPREDQLPDVLANLAFRNSVELTHARWSSDVQLLITALLPYVDTVSQPARAERSATSRAVAESAPESSAGAAPGTGSNHPEQPVAVAELAKKRPLFAFAAAVAIVLGFVGYLVSDRPPTNPLPTSAARTTADKAVSTRTDETPRASVVPRETPAVPATSVEASPALEAAASAPAEKGRGGHKDAQPTAARASAERSAVASAGIKRPAAPKREAPTVADRPAPDKFGVGQARYPVSEPSKDVQGKTEVAAPVPVTPPAPVVPLKVENATVAKVEPSVGNSGIALLGSAALPASATRTIPIYPDTRYVNVTGGDIVKFTVGSQSFAWNFNGRPRSFDLNAVAPPGVLDHAVKAYVAPNPLYMNPRR